MGRVPIERSLNERVRRHRSVSEDTQPIAVGGLATARRLMGTPIFARPRGACGALVGTFSHNFGGVKIKKLIGFGPLHFDPRGQIISLYVCWRSMTLAPT